MASVGPFDAFASGPRSGARYIPEDQNCHATAGFPPGPADRASFGIATYASRCAGPVRKLNSG